MNTIILAAGHGGNDSGATNGPHNERDQAILMVDHIANRLNFWARVGDAVVVAPHNLDTHECIPWINARYGWGSAWAIEVHRDSADTIKEPAASKRVGIYTGDSKLSRDIGLRFRARMVEQGADKSSWSRNQSESRFSRLGWIAQPRCLSHIIELGFMEGLNTREHLLWLAETAAVAIRNCWEELTGRAV